jgi:hypothetical protein
VLGLAGENVFGREETRKVLPDNLIGSVAENALGPGVPTNQMTTKPDQKDGVLLGVGRQEVEALSFFLMGELD